MSHSADKPIEIILFPLNIDDEKRRFLYGLLSDDEKHRAASYRFDKHRNRFITGRGTIREILANEGKCSPQLIRFELNQYGKPTLDEPASARHIQFNASSSETMGAIAISDNLPLGFDIEGIRPDSNGDYDNIVKNEFTRDEYNWYKKHDEADRVRVFFEFWTCKEAYLKALGIGLSGKLDSFSIDLSGLQPSVSYSHLEDSEQPQISMYRLNIAGGYVACLALAKKNINFYTTRW